MKPPAPSPASIARFLATCPALRGQPADTLVALASLMTSERHVDDARLLDDEIADRRSPLRWLAHGRASWSTSRDAEKRGAWMLERGSVIGVEAVNDWARKQQRPGSWTPVDRPRVTCRAMGPVWTLELAPARFAEAFSGAGGEQLCAALCRMYPTLVSAADVVAALRQTAWFARVPSPTLYRLLEYSPAVEFGAKPTPLGDELPIELDWVQQPLGAESLDAVGDGRALYYVLEGELQIPADDGVATLGPGELGGPSPFAAIDELRGAPFSEAGSRAVVISARAIAAMSRADPGFARSLGPQTSVRSEASK